MCRGAKKTYLHINGRHKAVIACGLLGRGLGLLGEHRLPLRNGIARRVLIALHTLLAEGHHIVVSKNLTE